MTLRHSTKGLVLNRQDYLDSDRIFSLFTKDFGRVEVFGKAIRKIDSKLRGGIELFSVSNVEFIEGRLKKTLTDAVFTKRFRNIFENAHLLLVTDRISKDAHEFIKGQEPDGEIWNLLIDVFEKLNCSQGNMKNIWLLYEYFFWNFMVLLGYGPELAHCVNCQKKLNPYELYFSNKEGGIVCRGCSAAKKEGVKITSNAVKVLRLIVKREWGVLSQLKTNSAIEQSLKTLSLSYRLYILQRPIA